MNQKGQTMVEYMLLLTVAISLVVTFYNSQAFQNLFGNSGSIGLKMKTETELAYRHAYFDALTPPPPYQGSNHPSYYDDKSGESRFFGPKEPYE
jgi:Flp pilus assembly pilin Flp